MDIADLKQRRADCLARAENLRKQIADLDAANRAKVEVIEAGRKELTDQVAMLDIAIKNPAAAASISGFIVSQASQPDREK